MRRTKNALLSDVTKVASMLGKAGQRLLGLARTKNGQRALTVASTVGFFSFPVRIALWAFQRYAVGGKRFRAI
jgi:hypothetical protein